MKFRVLTKQNQAHEFECAGDFPNETNAMIFAVAIQEKTKCESVQVWTLKNRRIFQCTYSK